MDDAILLAGLRALGVHGALPEEQSRKQPFEIDLEIFTDLAPAGRSDDLADTIDYGTIVSAVLRVVEVEHHQLLERLAQRLADVVLSWEHVSSVTVELRKLRPPVAAEISSAGVRITRP